jgi:hypothetical protein
LLVAGCWIRSRSQTPVWERNCPQSSGFALLKGKAVLKRIYIDNYKSLVNFDLEFKKLNLFLGANGSGKSAVFEVLAAIQQFVCHGKRTADINSRKSGCVMFR